MSAVRRRPAGPRAARDREAQRRRSRAARHVPRARARGARLRDDPRRRGRRSRRGVDVVRRRTGGRRDRDAARPVARAVARPRRAGGVQARAPDPQAAPGRRPHAHRQGRGGRPHRCAARVAASPGGRAHVPRSRAPRLLRHRWDARLPRHRDAPCPRLGPADRRQPRGAGRARGAPRRAAREVLRRPPRDRARAARPLRRRPGRGQAPPRHRRKGSSSSAGSAG